MESVPKKTYDLIILGAGPAGLTAAIYAGRARLDCLVLDKGTVGGQMATSYEIENYPAFPEPIGGPELAERMERQARRFGARLEMSEVTALELDVEEGRHEVVTPQGSYLARAVIIATGSSPRRLGVPGESRLQGRGVSYCATCDGAFFRDREVAVVGGGNTAVEEALFLTRYARRVTLIHRRDRFRAQRILAERARREPRIQTAFGTTVAEIQGEDRVERLILDAAGVRRELPVSGVFVAIGAQPNTSFLPPAIKRDEAGFIVAGQGLETAAAGVFAAGDARRKTLRQVATAVGDGSLAAMSAEQYISGGPYAAGSG